MSDLNPDLIDALNRSLSELGLTAEQQKKQLEMQSDAIKKFGAVARDSTRLQEDANKLLKKNNATVGDFAKELLGSKNRIKDLTYTIQNVDDALDKLGNAADTASRKEREQLQVLRDSLVIQQQHNAAAKTVVTGFRDLGGAVLKGVANSYTSAAKTALGGGDALATAGAFMTASIDTANAASQAGSKALGSFGEAAMMGGGKMKLVGLAAQGASAALGFLGNTVSELAKAGIGFMIQQTQKNIQGFQSMSAAGAIYSDGMMGMMKTAGQAGLTLEQMSKITANNNEQFSKTGLSIGEATKKMAGAMKEGGKEARQAMFGLGMSMEEQADVYATVMERLSGPNQKLHASDKEVADAAMAYARDLKTLQALTGEDLKSKKDKIRQENDTLAFQQKLAEMPKEKREALSKAMENMTEGQRRALRENMIYGNVISKDIAIAQASNSGIAESNQRFKAAVEDGSISAEKARDIQEQTAESIAEGAKANKGLALATGQDAAAGAKANLEYWQYSAKFTKEGKKAAKEAVDASMANAKSPEVTIMETNQKFALDMQKLAADNMEAFAKAIAQTTEDITKSVQELSKLGLAAATLPPWIVTLLGIGTSLIDMAWPILKMLGIGGAGAGAAAGGGGTAAATGAAAAGSAMAAPLAVLGAGAAITVSAGNAMKNNESMQDAIAAGGDPEMAFGAAIMGAGRNAGAQNPADFIKFGSGTGDQAHFEKLDPGVRNKFMSMAQAYYTKTGKMLQINSAFRTAEEQAKVNSGTNPKAAPGKSLHNVGRALDINSSQVADLQSLGMLGRYGFGPLAGDPPHIQALDGGGEIEGAEVALVGEKGPELVSGPASVTSRSNTNELFTQMNSNLEAMLRVLKDQHGTSEKILYASS